MSGQRNTRWGLLVIPLVIVVSSCAARGPLKLSLMPTQAASGTNRAVGVNSDVALESLYPSLTYDIQGDLSLDRISGFAWSIVQRPKSKVAFRELAKSLGVEGDIVKNEKNSFTIGVDEKTGRGMWLWVDDAGSWWSYSNGSTATAVTGCVKTPVEASPDGSPGDSIDPGCVVVEPPKPKNLLSEKDALLRTYTVMAAAGYNLAAFDVRATKSDWSTDVTGVLLIAGVPTNIPVSMSFGENGVLSYASGPFVYVKRANGYYLVTPQEAVKRLSEPRFASWNGAARIAADMVVGAPNVDSPDSSEPIVVPITGVRYSLMQVTLSNLTTLLIPAYTYSNSDGDVGTVIAIKDEYLLFDETPTSLEPGPVPVPITDGGGSGGSSGGSSGSGGAPTPEPLPPDEPQAVGVEAARKLIGLKESEALKVAAANRWTVRIAARDGESFMLTTDYSPSRVNLSILEGLVTAVSIG